jgi:P27 family predicted phage terminase small subunit
MSPEASKHWDAILPELTRVQILSPVQLGNLNMLCESYARWKACQIIRRRDGITREGPHGPVANPAVVQESAALKDYLRLSQEFGMTPSAEQRISTDKDDGDGGNPFAGVPQTKS